MMMVMMMVMMTLVDHFNNDIDNNHELQFRLKQHSRKPVKNLKLCLKKPRKVSNL